MFASNQPDAFFMEKTDRRYAIFQMPAAPMTPDFVAEMRAWIHSETGLLSLRWYFEKEVDMKGFSPFAPAIHTVAKDIMMLNAQTDLTMWITDMLANPDAVLRLGGAVIKDDLVSSKMLLDIFMQDHPGSTRITANAIAREMARAGVDYVCNGQTIRTADHRQARYFPVRNREKWAKAEVSRVRDYLNGTSAEDQKAHEILKADSLFSKIQKLNARQRAALIKYVEKL
jgi:hypothetical protein